MNDNTEALPPLPRKLADHIEHRLRTWRQTHMNLSGDRLALDDFMGEDSIADLVDFVCDEYALDAALVQRQQVPGDWPTLREELEDVCKAADQGANGWVRTSRIREAITAAPSAQAEPRHCPACGYELPAPPTAQAEQQVPLPFNSSQRRRLWDNSPEIHADAKSFAAFERIVQLVEAAHGIGKQEVK